MLFNKSYNSDSSKESSALDSPLNLFDGCTGIEAKKKSFGLTIFHINILYQVFDTICRILDRIVLTLIT